MAGQSNKSNGHRRDWDEYFLEMSDLVSSRSRDDCQVGAVIVGDDHEVLATGYNGIPRRVADIGDRITKEDGEKYKWTVHAEANAICNAARVGVPIKGGTVYVTKFPCSHCAGELVQAGIRRLVTHDTKFWRNDPSKDDGSSSLRILMEAGVEIHAPHIPIGELIDHSKKRPKQAARTKSSTKRRVDRKSRQQKRYA